MSIYPDWLMETGGDVIEVVEILQYERFTLTIGPEPVTAVIAEEVITLTLEED